MKNSRKLALVLVVLVILLPSLAMMIIRPHYIKGQGNSEPNFNTSSFMSTLTHSNYVLYAEEKQRENQAAMIPFDIFFPSALNDTQTKKMKRAVTPVPSPILPHRKYHRKLWMKKTSLFQIQRYLRR
ncbi:MAG: hypothetical protein ACLRMZ_07155 [Blautia marasmi]